MITEAVTLCFPMWSVLPFIAMLLSIAIIPMVVPDWWDSNRNKTILSVVLSLPVLALILPCDPNLLKHSLLDYFSFLSLLGALFVISGGIHVSGEFAGTPLVNTIFLAIGALLANVIGTTGASMLLVRPYIRANHVLRDRDHCITCFIFFAWDTAGRMPQRRDRPVSPGFF